MILWISKRIPKPKKYTPIDVIGVDVNEKIAYGDEIINIEKTLTAPQMTDVAPNR